MKINNLDDLKIEYLILNRLRKLTINETIGDVKKDSFLMELYVRELAEIDQNYNFVSNLEV